MPDRFFRFVEKTAPLLFAFWISAAVLTVMKVTPQPVLNVLSVLAMITGVAWVLNRVLLPRLLDRMEAQQLHGGMAAPVAVEIVNEVDVERVETIRWHVRRMDGHVYIGSPARQAIIDDYTSNRETLQYHRMPDEVTRQNAQLLELGRRIGQNDLEFEHRRNVSRS